MLVDAHVHGVPFRIHEEFKRIGLAAIFDHCPRNEMQESIDNLLADMEKADVSSSIVITSCTLDLFDEYAKKYPKKLFVGFLFDSRNPKEGLRAVRRAVEKYPHLIKCVKTMFPYLGQHPLMKEFLPLYGYCEQAGLPVQFHIGGDQNMEQISNPLYFAKLASLHPTLSIVCLHAGGGMVEKIPLLMELWPNIFLEVEGLQLNEAEGSREPQVLRFLLEHVDSSRLMFGSDRIFPEEKYFWRVQAVRSLAPEHADNLSWKTANRVFDLGLDRKRKLGAAKREAKTAKKTSKAGAHSRSQPVKTKQKKKGKGVG